MIAGYLVFMAAGRFDWELVQRMPVFVTPDLFPFGFRVPAPELVLAMTLVTLFMSVNLYGNLKVYGRLVGMPVDSPLRRRGLLTFGAIETGLTGILGVPGTVPYSENLGIVALTRVASRFTLALAAGLLIVLSLVGTMAGFMAAMPPPLAGAVLLGVAANLIGIGASTWTRAPHFGPREHFIVSFAVFLALGLSLLPPATLAEVPQLVRTLIANPVIFAVLVVVMLEQVVFRTVTSH